MLQTKTKPLVDPEKLFLEELLEGYIRWPEAEPGLKRRINKTANLGFNVNKTIEFYKSIQMAYNNGEIEYLRQKLENCTLSWHL